MSARSIRVRRRGLVVLALISTIAWAVAAADNERSIVVASTTSTEDSGLFDYLLPIFKSKTGITVRVVAQGTGQALDTGRRGDADVVLVHSRAEELKFVAEGESLKRYPVMYNDFVLIGPKGDPAGVSGMHDIARALQAIRDHRADFVSRGDRSGTHLAELGLWKAAGIDIGSNGGRWYKSIGQGMGAALNFAAATNAYVLSDRGTWLHFANKRELQIVVEGDQRLFNQYGVMLVNPKKHPNVRQGLGQTFIDYLVSPEGQRDIANYRINGQQLFCPDAQSERQVEVAAHGAQVMPFRLSATTHIFSKTADGALQQVIAKDTSDEAQIALIREHLSEVAAAFSRGDFSGPTHVHGAEMPGLAKLKSAKPGDIKVAYRETPQGAQITYSSSAASFVNALHEWVDAQLADHGADAREDREQMH